MHSWPKEMQHFEKIPNLHCFHWDLTYPWISGEPFDIFGWGFLGPVSNSCDIIRLSQGHLTLGHRGDLLIHGAFLLRLSVHFIQLYSLYE